MLHHHSLLLACFCSLLSLNEVHATASDTSHPILARIIDSLEAIPPGKYLEKSKPFLDEALPYLEDSTTSAYYRGMILLSYAERLYYEIHFSNAADTTELAIEAFKATGDDVLLGRAYAFKGLIFLREQKPVESLPILLHAKELLEANKDQASSYLRICYNNLGINYVYLGKTWEGLHYYQLTADLSLDKEDFWVAGATYLNMANQYQQLNLVEEALRYYKLSDSLINKSEVKSLWKVPMNISRNYLKLNSLDSALVYLRKAEFQLNDGKEVPIEDYGMAHSKILMILSQIKRGEHEIAEAVDAALLGKEIIDRGYTSNQDRIEHYLWSGDVLLVAGRTDEALEILNHTHKWAVEYQNPFWEYKTLLLKAKTYRSLGDMRSALQALQDGAEKKNVYVSQGNNAVFKLKASELENIRKLEEENRQRQLEILRHNQNNNKLLALGLLIGLLFISMLIFFRNKKSRIQRKIFRTGEKIKSTELQLIELEKQKIQERLLKNEADINDFARQLIERNELFQSIQLEIEDLLNSGKPTLSKLTELVTQFEKEKVKQNDWNEFVKRFDSVHQDFVIKINNQFPALSLKDTLLCRLLRLELSSKEIAPLLQMNHASVNTARYRLRKKMNLSEEQDLANYLRSI